jgi:Fe-S-cluster containining protein
MNDDSPWGLTDVDAWRAAASDALVAAELEWIYAEVTRAVEGRRPVCWTSGRCCHFEKVGHRLYVTGLEAAWTLARLDAGITLSRTGLDEASGRGGCPFQVERLCLAHEARPLGCRVYFCDASADIWQQELYEAKLQHLRQLHERHGIPYAYGEWRAMLERFLGARADMTN